MSRNQFITITILSTNPPMKPVSTITPMEHNTGHKTPRNQPRPTASQVPPQSSEKCRMQEQKLPLEPKGKQQMKKSRNEKAPTTPLA